MPRLRHRSLVYFNCPHHTISEDHNHKIKRRKRFAVYRLFVLVLIKQGTVFPRCGSAKDLNDLSFGSA
jgi:hypothetical protein